MSNHRIPSIPLDTLVTDIKACRLCEEHLPHGARPVVQLNQSAKILIVGQAPGRRVHESGIPWDDLSGNRLRQWMQLTKEAFYDSSDIAIMPMGFCYPGTGKSGDLPPRNECAKKWHQPILEQLPNIQLTILIGQYAQRNYLNSLALTTNNKQSLTERVRSWQTFLPAYLPLPHPSPRNQSWLKKNDWFESEVVPCLQHKVYSILSE